jgi:hypothetical protein
MHKHSRRRKNNTRLIVNDMRHVIEYKKPLFFHGNHFIVQKYLKMMDNEYVFNYDEVKQRFESVPQTNSVTKKFKSMTYKTYFQPRTKSIIGKNDLRSNIYPLMANKSQRQERLLWPKMTFQVHVIHLQQITPIEQFSLQTQQGFYIMPDLIK